MQAVFAYVIGLGAAVMMPVIFTVLGTLIGIKFSKALKSGLLVGVGFVGLGVVTALLMGFTGSVPKSSTYDRLLNQYIVSFGPGDVLDATPTQIVLPFPEEFKNVDLHPDKRYRRLYFEMFSRGGKESSEPRSVKYTHGVLIGPKA